MEVEEGKSKGKAWLPAVFSRKDKGDGDEPVEGEPLPEAEEIVPEQAKAPGIFQKIFSRQASATTVEVQEEGEAEVPEKTQSGLGRFFSKQTSSETPGESEQQPPSQVSTPKPGVNRFKDWLQRREADEEVVKVEGIEPGDSKESSLRRLFQRSRPGTLESGVKSESQGDIGTGSTKSPSELTKRHRFRLAFRQRHHSEEAPSPTEPAQLPNIEESQVKSRSLTRPRKLWIGSRSRSEQKSSPDLFVTPTVPTATPDPALTPELEQKGSSPHQSKHSFFQSLRGRKGRQEQSSEAQKKKKSEASPERVKEDTLQRAESYELAMSDINVIKSKDSKDTGEGGTSKIKLLLKQKSEVILRPFSRRTATQEKRKSAPLPHVEVTPKEPEVEVPDIEARHPSISTYIDETPSAFTSPHILPDEPVTIESDPFSSDITHSDPQQVPGALSPEQHPQSPESDSDSLVLDLHSMQSTPDVVRRDPDSRVSTLERALSRRLTFSLPFGSAGGGGAAADDDGLKPVERAIEARSQTSDYIGSMVRCLHLTKCFIANSKSFFFYYH